MKKNQQAKESQETDFTKFVNEEAKKLLDRFMGKLKQQEDDEQRFKAEKDGLNKQYQALLRSMIQDEIKNGNTEHGQLPHAKA